MRPTTRRGETERRIREAADQSENLARRLGALSLHYVRAWRTGHGRFEPAVLAAVAAFRHARRAVALRDVRP